MVAVKKHLDVFADLGEGRNSWKIKNNTCGYHLVLRLSPKNIWLQNLWLKAL